MIMKKKFTKYRTQVFSRHPSHQELREKLLLLPFRSVIRLGSTTVSNPRLSRIELNSINSIKISSNKLSMKGKFDEANISHAEWFYGIISGGQMVIHKQTNHELTQKENLPYPIIVKHIHGSRGTGNTLLKSVEEFNSWVQGKTISNYIIEKFYSYTKEYRLHVSKNGCFYTCRKMLKRETPEELRFQRHDDNCVWVVESNELFDKPVNWDSIVDDCKAALHSIGADILAFDVKVQSAKKANGVVRTEPKYIIIESNSAPSFGSITLEKYLIEIPKLLKDKYERI